MNRWPLLFLALLATATGATGQEKPATPSPTTYQCKTDLFYLNKKEAEVTPYQRQLCRLDLYYPTDTRGFATIVWIHGGGLWGGKREIPSLWKNQGFAVAALDYRLHPHVTCPAYIEDVAAGTAWVFANIQHYGGNPDAVFVTGASAGGYLASMIALDKRWLRDHHVDADRIAGLVAISGHAITHMTVRKEQGIDPTQVRVDQFAPLYHVRPAPFPILLFTGDREMELLGRYEENAYFMRMLKVAGQKDVTLHELQGYDHGPIHHAAFLPALRWMQKALARRSRSTQETPESSK